MREILFKAKRIDNGEWVEGFIIINKNGSSWIKDTDYHVNDGYCDLIPYRVIPETVCQYTGLTDKNGVKIWEGDILKGGIYLKYEVKWDYEDCGWNIPESAINFVVIGNIHDKQPTL